MVMKNDGHERKHKTKIKCDKCKGTFNLEDAEVINFEGLRYTECIYCGEQIILKNK